MWNSNGGGSNRERQAFPAVRQQTPAAPLLAAATPHLRATVEACTVGSCRKIRKGAFGHRSLDNLDIPVASLMMCSPLII